MSKSSNQFLSNDDGNKKPKRMAKKSSSSFQNNDDAVMYYCRECNDYYDELMVHYNESCKPICPHCQSKLIKV